MEMDYIINVLKSHNCRITPQRNQLLAVLIDNQSKLLSPEQITSLCQNKKTPDINMTTVYRNLALLLKYQLIIDQQIDRYTTGYKLKCYNGHHHHLTCITCGQMIPFEYCPMLQELKNLANSHKFTVIDHKLELLGYCNNCSNSQ